MRLTGLCMVVAGLAGEPEAVQQVVVHPTRAALAAVGFGSTDWDVQTEHLDQHTCHSQLVAVARDDANGPDADAHEQDSDGCRRLEIVIIFGIKCSSTEGDTPMTISTISTSDQIYFLISHPNPEAGV
jgi:hypothetical protein